MARDFNGVNENVDFGTDASIDGFALQSFALWVSLDATTAQALLLKGQTGVGWGSIATNITTLIRFASDWTTDGNWISTNAIAATVPQHVAVVYDNGLTTNVPTIYLNGVAETLSTNTAPTGTYTGDAANSLFIGTNSALGNDLDGRIGHVCYDNTLWDAAMVNRHRWWGCAPGGPSTVKVWHPLWTTTLVNKGTATATGTATGSVVENASVPRVERMWGSMMGVGR